MAFLVGISGKIGSGKDYLTEKLIEELESRGRTTGQTTFAKPLKEELGEIIDLLQDNRHLNVIGATLLLKSKKKMNLEQAGWLAERLHPELNIPDLNGWSRTLGVRSSLQILGTDIRRAQYPNYWTDKFLAEVRSMDSEFVLTPHTLREQPVVFASDGRFPNEMDCINDNGGLTFRLDISEETLLKRRTGRDGIIYTPEQLNHPSETALDDYTRFDHYVGETFDVAELADLIENAANKSNL